MSEPRAQRTLVKSPPELWAEVSDVSTLARHLGEFGEIRITRLEAETTVVWEGDRARGTVELEPSGWGTKVTLTAEAIAAEAAEAVEEPEPEPEPEPVAIEPEPEPEHEPEPEPVVEDAPAVVAQKQGFFARLFGRRRAKAAAIDVPEPIVTAPEAIHVPTVAAPEPEPEPEPEPVAAVVEPEPIAVPAFEADIEAVLVGVLDDL